MKERIDKILFERGLAESRAKAHAMILAGEVKVRGQRVDKPGTLFDPEFFNIFDGDGLVEILQKSAWVSRGALKLLRAFEVFALDVRGKICADIGASTGGFVEVLLKNGAARVYAVDVGYGQLAWKLATDERVVVMDRTNGRELNAARFDLPVNFITTDASFISLRLLLPAIELSLFPGGSAVVLIKPQFEAGKDRVGKGVVHSKNIHIEVLESLFDFIDKKTSFGVLGLAPSPIKGQKGNIEFLCHLGFLSEPVGASTARLSDQRSLLYNAKDERQASNDHKEGSDPARPYDTMTEQLQINIENIVEAAHNEP